MTEQENKPRIFRPSFNERELKLVCKALHFYKIHMEEVKKTGLTMGGMRDVASLLINLLALLHGKKVGRRKDVPTFHYSDEALLHFKTVKEEWLKELET